MYLTGFLMTREGISATTGRTRPKRGGFFLWEGAYGLTKVVGQGAYERSVQGESHTPVGERRNGRARGRGIKSGGSLCNDQE